MRPNSRSFIAVILVSLLPVSASAEKWVEFHSESWSSGSEKLGRDLLFCSRHYYDAENVKAVGNRGFLISIREISQNDRFYVDKGIPEKEAVYKQILLDCDARRYEVLLEGDFDAAANEASGDEIKTGSMYDKLSILVCKVKKEKKKGGN